MINDIVVLPNSSRNWLVANAPLESTCVGKICNSVIFLKSVQVEVFSLVRLPDLSAMPMQ